MTLALDFPESGSSFLGRWDPRWKLAALLPAAVMAALLQSVPAASLALVSALVLAFLGRLPPRWLLARLGTLALVLTLFLLWLPFSGLPGPVWEIGWVRLSGEGARVALLLLLKASTIVTLMLVLAAIGSLAETFKAAHSLHLPGRLVQVCLLTYRYIFLVMDELGRLRLALRVRGYRHRANLHSYRTVGHVAGTLLVRSAERADRVAQAMRCRGFDGCFRTLTIFQTRAKDIILFLAVIGGATGLFLWDWWYLSS